FSRANNQGIKLAKGKYILLLNPDTVVEEDTFQKTLAFMEANPQCGALGVRMFNGRGEFLPESKRALPTPWVAFYKVFGLSRIFPKSKKFGKYHLTYLDPNQTHVVDVLSGAFMLIRREVLDKIGLLDETFFMYGEDIDLSYRITQAGYKNYYFADTRIIHYKGESTKKGSLNYVLVFYNAMLIFAKKHFAKGRVSLFIFLIQLAIYFRASLAILKRLWQRSAIPILEGAFIWGSSVFIIKYYWQKYFQYSNGIGAYPSLLDWLMFLYAIIFVIFLALFQNYKRPYKLKNIVTAVVGGFICIAVLNFIFRDINFSRAIVVFFALATFFISTFLRGLLNFIRTGNFLLDEKIRKRVVIIGDTEEAQRVTQLLETEIHYPCQIIGYIYPDTNDTSNNNAATISLFPSLGELSQVEEIIRFYAIEEIIFCNKSLSTRIIIEQMSRLAHKNIGFKIVPPLADYLIGPNTILTSVEFQPQIANLCKPEYLFQKRIFDGVMGFFLILCFPFLFWLFRKPWQALRNLYRVFWGSYHLVGYIQNNNPDLPRLKYGLLDMRILFNKAEKKRKLNHLEFERLDRLYAQTYSLALDWEILITGFRNLDAQK
ncbi:MAG: glycosyltransferase, partial [Bacteroidia bacterium]|nr:glycosyltransferase [Bacteroidia bacterium]MDW8159427.1 glycosyltransferase [Bacteroidia bacterium]